MTQHQASTSHNTSHDNRLMVGMIDCIAYAICGAVTRQTVSRHAIVVYNKMNIFYLFLILLSSLWCDAFEMGVAILCMPYIFWYPTSMCTTYSIEYNLTNHAMELWGTMYYIVATTWHYRALWTSGS